MQSSLSFSLALCSFKVCVWNVNISSYCFSFFKRWHVVGNAQFIARRHVQQARRWTFSLATLILEIIFTFSILYLSFWTNCIEYMYVYCRVFKAPCTRSRACVCRKRRSQPQVNACLSIATEEGGEGGGLNKHQSFDLLALCVMLLLLSCMHARSDEEYGARRLLLAALAREHW